MQALKNINEALAFFEGKAHLLDAQTQADIKSGKKEFHLADFYIRKKLSGGSGIIDLIKARLVVST